MDEGCEVMVLTPHQMMTLHALIEPSLNRDQTIKHRIKLIGTGNLSFWLGKKQHFTMYVTFTVPDN